MGGGTGDGRKIKGDVCVGVLDFLKEVGGKGIFYL
jgi:hypothetical protein